MLVTCQNIGRAFIYWLRYRSTEEERTTICSLLACEGGEEPPIPPDCIPNWQASGARYCLQGQWIEPQSDGCGNTRQYPTNEYCNAPCIPEMYGTNTYRCNGNDYEQLWRDICDPVNVTEWRRVGPVVWTPVVPEQTSCNGDGFVEVYEVSQCGTNRWRVTAETCGEPCEDDYVATSTYRCINGRHERLFEATNCGATKQDWRDQGPETWTPQGDPWCGEGNKVMQTYENQCGNTKDEQIPRTWVDVAPANFRCVPCAEYPADGCYQKQEVDPVCGVTRWVTIGPVTWTTVTPYEFSCIDNIVHKQQVNSCGTDYRWVPTAEPGTPCGLEPDPLTVTTGSHVDGIFSWGLPCDVPAQTSTGVSAHETVVVSGGSGSYSYSWAVSEVVGDVFPYTVSHSPSSPSISLMSSSAKTCPFEGVTEIAYTVTVTDTVTGAAGSVSSGLLIEFTG